MLQRLVVVLLCYLAIIPMLLHRRLSSSKLDPLSGARHYADRRFQWLPGRRDFLRDSAYFALPVIGAFALFPLAMATHADPPLVAQTVNAAFTAEMTASGVGLPEQSSAPMPVPSTVAPVTSAREDPVAETLAADPLPTDVTAAVASTVPEPAASGAAPAEATARETFSHTVQAGDSVNKLAAANGLQPNTIVRANGLTNPDRILPGQQLVIPSDDSYARPPEPAPAARPTGNRELDFIAAIASGARESQRVTGVPASVTIGQAILETYWGTSFLAREANNYFGIKAHARPGPAGVVWIDAWEVENGANVTRQEPFRKYHTVAESLVEHGWFFIENKRYAHAMQAASDPKEFARRINTAGYATDPAYAAKLIAYMDRYNLYQYDLN